MIKKDTKSQVGIDSMKIKCRNCKKIIKTEGYTCSVAEELDRFCDEWCVKEWADRYFRINI